MVTEVNSNIQKFRGLSTDTKPSGIANGSEFLAMDTGVTYYYDEDGTEWVTVSSKEGD